MQEDFYDFVQINPSSRIPKYRQLADSIMENIASGKLTLNQKIPSINGLSEEFYLSRDTVEKAYKILKENKIISSVKGKGYYITRTDLSVSIKVLFLINKLSAYKMRIYNSFVEKIQSDARVDLHIYHCDELLFCSLAEKNLGAYDYYVIMPHFKTESLRHISYTDKVIEVLRKFPKDRLVILDNQLDQLSGFIEIYQDFENDIYHALNSFMPDLKKYSRFIMVYPMTSIYPYPMRMLRGFRKFCAQHDIDFEIIDEIYEDMILKKGDLFLVVGEGNLVNLVKQVRNENIQLGIDLGIISYNETPLKGLLNIAVVSTDFVAMGRMAAEMIQNNKSGVVKNPFYHIKRESF